MRLIRSHIRKYLFVAAFALFVSAQCHSQAALLLEEPYGFFGALNPTGHNAIYFSRICAQTPVTLRRCQPGETGSVIARYQGIDGYDWVAIPLVPYLYSVENASDAPARVDRAMVKRLRDRYREQHLISLGPNVDEGDLVHGGWTQLVGVAYERRIYAFRFNTTPQQDDALIAQLNAGPNRSHFNLLYANCADFARKILNAYFPGTFKRSIFPDAGMTSPKQITYKLTRYANKNPGLQLAVYQIPQVPGYRRQSRSNKDVVESLSTTLYAVPIALVNPYLAVGLFADYMARGRFHFVPSHPPVLTAADLSVLDRSSANLSAPDLSASHRSLLTAPTPDTDNLASAGSQAHRAAAGGSSPSISSQSANSGLSEIGAPNE